MNVLSVAAKPARGFGGFIALSAEIFTALVRPPYAWGELLDQISFVSKVSALPALMLTIPYSVFSAFLLNILLLEIGASDLSGSGQALVSVTQISPLVTAIVVAGTGAAAMCADLGARTIREEVDAMRVIGIDPVRALALPRVIAATVVSLFLYGLVAVFGLAGSYLFVVYAQHVTPGAFVAGLTLVVHLPEVIISLVKATLYGLSAGLIACYKGFTVGGGPTGVGNAVNETVVFSFMALFTINILVTAVGVKATL
jgi:phospholipid/cholesterol/gamma-HCH transport system permease protein